MRILSITLRRAIKISLGNYENTDVSCEMTAEIEEGEGWDLVRQHLSTSVHLALEDEVKSIFRLRDQKISEAEDTRITKKARNYGV